MIRLSRQFIVLVILLCLYSYSYTNILHFNIIQNETRIQKSIFTTIPPCLLKFIAGEFKGVLGLYITLDVGSRIGTELKRNQDGGYISVDHNETGKFLMELLSVGQFVDPTFQQTYIMAQGIFPWSYNLVSETQDILRISCAHRPWDWQPLRYMAFNSYFFNNDYGTAGKFMLQAAKIPNAPSFLAILGARLAQRGNKTESAIVMMREMLENTSKNERGSVYVSLEERLQALEGVFILEQAIKEYKVLYQQDIPSLDALLDVKLLKELPGNPYNVDYCIDETGVIYFDRPNCKH